MELGGLLAKNLINLGSKFLHSFLGAFLIQRNVTVAALPLLLKEAVAWIFYGDDVDFQEVLYIFQELVR